ncbi:uncharacterized protein LOC106066234 [Biomphalaria glabrata]|uniref:Uncharacterized protein LOC106066234 n=1 Tax=Biomphalaria glabrata TaxID=6526 RepID=A0A9W2YBR0_BIOGL|nr:uncharacterized protein LOC106066234 [Biomphalaria glabrata]
MESTNFTSEQLPLSPLELSAKVRQDQGLHEADVSCGDEADLRSIFRTCTKNPEHIGFIPVHQFEACHLPLLYRDLNFVSYVRAMAGFAVRVLVRCISTKRPKEYPGTDNPYPFYHYKGAHFLRVGSGWVDGAGMTFLPENNRRCPCRKCAASEKPSYTWCQFWVHTALHVVYNREEAQHTQCELFYDSETSRDLVSVLDGVDTVGSCLEDTCSILCVTHDIQVVGKLNLMWAELHQLQESMSKSLTRSDEMGRLSIIVSHPHGSSKRISVGEWTHRQSHGDDWTQYYYTTNTCSGSSGAPVYLLGKERGLQLVTNHPHSARCEDISLNTSGIWWE